MGIMNFLCEVVALLFVFCGFAGNSGRCLF